ncbi:NUDIX domain-containing protein [Haloechinothrix sp. LS1_15]|uniref:NUDIX domain-containing protein n=1 Tax=Haloechinothrix sp. LS1_15 TaxID=2652248 RepID=UPI002945AF6B|nr:NUDIX domain-containing protein [Haloechinothrix sp. LS1_15]MDV6010910.1 NUDIX domain-containing protein [Haloechinothrix sp. LS1_15]
MPDRHLVDVHVLLVRDTELLLTKRRGGAFNGMWHLPSGKLDAGEDVLSAAAREAEEEVGVLIDPRALTHVHTIHVNGSGPEPRLGLFFATTRWIGEPSNREPAKCSGIGWFEVRSLPGDLIGYPAAGIDAYLRGVPFSVMGWTEEEHPAAVVL